ncbi:NAC domain-containing protein 8-like protein [Carex littledalei]|uniref:NAC domain-containing protein 8-like protein n=1 Tax=Carex littledalei TaxID=544730 RepID=A0A833VQZ3_9POAL|nr:NAC domain-containing protein 8-like protein [Carex littledalei]
MTGPSWLVDSRRIATKIKNASEQTDPTIAKWPSNPTKSCPNCNHVIDNSDVVHEWPGLPKGVKFDPSDQELLWHLLAKAGRSNTKPHPFIDEFIPTVEQDEGICYTHPKRLPGVKQDGSVSHFFHRTFKAYNTGTRKRRKINTDDSGDVRWHKTGKTKPVSIDGKHIGCKKIMVLYMSTSKGGKPEKTNWVMHQYHLGTDEDEKDGEYVVSKLFYQQQAQKTGEKIVQDVVDEVGMDLNLDMVDVPKLYHTDQTGHEKTVQEPELASEPIVPQEQVDIPEIQKGEDPIEHDEYEKPDNEISQPMEESRWNCEGQFSEELMDSQQLAANISVLNEFLLSQSQSESQMETGCGEEQQKRSLVPCGGGTLSHYVDKPEELKKDLKDCIKVATLENLNYDTDKANEFRLSQLDCYKDNESQDSFLTSLAGAG